MATKNSNTGKSGRRTVVIEAELAMKMAQQNDTNHADNGNLSWMWSGEKDAQPHVPNDNVDTATDVTTATNVAEMAEPIDIPIPAHLPQIVGTEVSTQKHYSDDVNKGTIKNYASNSTKRMTVAVRKAMSEDKEEKIEATAMTEVNKATDVTNINHEEVTTPKSIERKATSPPRTTRVSFKMRETTRKGFCEDYTRKVATKGGKPITIASDLLERLQNLCVLSRDFKSCPTYIINNLIREFLDIVEPVAQKWGTQN